MELVARYELLRQLGTGVNESIEGLSHLSARLVHKELHPPAAGRGRRDDDLFSSLRGTQIIKSIVRGHEALSVTPSATQVAVQNAVLLALVPLLYRADYTAHRALIEARLGLDPEEVRRFVAMQCPRRHGKSMSMAMLVALLLRYCDGLDIMVLSTGERTAKAFVALVRQFMPAPGDGGPEGEQQVRTSESQQGISAWPSGSRNMNRLFAVPANSDTTRGVTAQLIIVDECAFMPPGMLIDVAFPLAQVDGTVLIAISSPPKSAGNTFSEMFTATREDGTKIFWTHVVRALCPVCRAADLTECPHLAASTPHWISSETKKDLAVLYERDRVAYNREMGGLDETGDRMAFAPGAVTAFQLAPPVELVAPPAFIMVSVDPAAGGNASCVAVVAGCYTADDVFVVSRGPARGVGAHHPPLADPHRHLDHQVVVGGRRAVLLVAGLRQQAVEAVAHKAQQRPHPAAHRVPVQPSPHGVAVGHARHQTGRLARRVGRRHHPLQLVRLGQHQPPQPGRRVGRQHGLGPGRHVGHHGHQAEEGLAGPGPGHVEQLAGVHARARLTHPPPAQILGVLNFDLSTLPAAAQWTRTVGLMLDLRVRPALRGATFVVAVEADLNTAMTRDFELAVRQQEQRLGTVVFMHECASRPDLPGVFKGKNGDRYKRAMETLLLGDRRLAVWGHARLEPENAPALLVTQLRAFKLCVRPAHDPVRSNPMPVWSGKAQGPDDLAVAAMMAVFWAAHFRASRRYRRARRGLPELQTAGLVNIVHEYQDQHGTERDLVPRT